MEPADFVSWATRGTAHLRAGNLDQALSDFHASLKLNPEYYSALNNIAHIYSERKGNNKKAIEFLDMLVDLRPQNAVTLVTRGVVHARIGNEKLALEDAEHALKLKDDADIHYRIAGLFAQLSSIEKKHALTAIKHLALAATKNAQTVSRMLKTDPDIKPLQQNSEFQDLLSQIRAIQDRTKD